MVRPFVAAGLMAVALAGCSGYELKRKVETAELTGDWDQAVVYYLQLVREDPTNLEYRTGLRRAKIAASQTHFEIAKRLIRAGQLEQALVELQETVQLDTTNQYAQVELEKVRELVYANREHRDISTQVDTLKDATRGASAQPPVLDPRSDEPIDLSFPEPVSVMDIYRALGKAFGLNVLFDQNLRDQQISIELAEVTAEEALEMLMRAAGHFYKVVDEHSILIAADTAPNRRAYEDLVIQTFFLSNSEVRDVMTMLRSLVDSRKIAANERLNAIVLRDTADKVKVAQQLIATNDKSRAEVVVDVELMQVNSTKLREIGLSLEPGNQIGFSLDSEQVSGLSPEAGSTVRFSDIDFIDSTSWLLSLPSFLLDFVKESTDAQILAQPKLRISEGETASFTVAEQIPIPVTSFNTANTVGSNIVPITSFQYQDVGIILEIEPRVHHNNEVTLVISLEVSNVTGEISNQPIIGTRNVETTIRLKDGETNFLAGLIRSDEFRGTKGLPGLSSIPVLGRLFSRKETQVQTTDIVLTMTPHIIRRADITEQDLLPIWVGTETNFSLRGGGPRIESEEESPFDLEDEDPDATSARERLRQRLENLPRNLEEAEPEEEVEPDGAGVELVPGGAPRRRRRDDSDDVSALPHLPLPFPAPAGWPPASGPRHAFVRAAPSGEEASIELRLVPVAASVAAGQQIAVRLEVESAQEISHLPLTLDYDDGELRLVRVERGDFLGPEGEATLLVDRATPGAVVIGASRLGGGPGVSGKGVLLTLHFEALRAGGSEVRFERSKVMGPAREVLAPVGTTAATVLVVARRVPETRKRP